MTNVVTSSVDNVRLEGRAVINGNVQPTKGKVSNKENKDKIKTYCGPNNLNGPSIAALFKCNKEFITL